MDAINQFLIRNRTRIFLIWTFLSLLMLVFGGLFAIDEWLWFPQHEKFEHFKKVSDIIQDDQHKTNYLFYRLFFAVDFIWAILLLWLIGTQIQLKKGTGAIVVKSSSLAFKIFFAVAVIAYALDVVEGIKYLSFNSSGLEMIVRAKKIFYGLAFSYMLYWLMGNFVIPNGRSGLRFFTTSIISIFFIAAVYLLITIFPQGGTLMVDMFFNPVNLIIFFVLLAFLAVLLSHYPVYLDIWGYDRTVRIRMAKGFTFLGFGILYYDTSTSKKDNCYKEDRIGKTLSRSLGVLLYVVVFQIIITLASTYYELYFNTRSITLLFLVMSLTLFGVASNKHMTWKQALYDEKVDETAKLKIVGQVVRFVKWYPRLIGLTIVVVITLGLISELYGWNALVIAGFILALFMNMGMYIWFKFSRDFLKYVYYSAGTKTRRKALYDDNLAELFQKYFTKHPKKLPSKALIFLGRLSDNIVYLKIMRFIGIISLISLILSNAFFGIASFLNPVNIILLYIIIYYSLFVILLKHFLYYFREKDEVNPFWKYVFNFVYPILLLVLLVLLNVAQATPSDLHELQLAHKDKQMIMEDYLREKMEKQSDSTKPYFFVGSYGGGLKANLWNLLLFNELDSLSQNQFRENTLVMSGVSGGAVGIGNYTSLIAHKAERNRFGKEIFDIGTSNVLSNEITYLLGWDWIREYMPFIDHMGKDRSFFSMRVHAVKTGMTPEEYTSKSLEDIWDVARDNSGVGYPFLVLNTTSAEGKQGVATSIHLPETAFPGAIRIHEFNGEKADSSLTFFGAVATTNRFPFFSPTAKITGKGSFVDGGYFENSGMLSAWEVWNEIKTNQPKELAQRIDPIFVNIINSRDSYVYEKLNELGVPEKFEDEGGEIGTILSTLASTEKLPRYAIQKIKMRGAKYISIMLPHKLTFKDVQDHVKGEIKNPLDIMRKIKEHNQQIQQVLDGYAPYPREDWGVVEPPLARLLSLPAVRYEQAMLRHPEVVEKIKDLLSYIAR